MEFDQTRDQLHVLLSLHRENGVVARYLVEEPKLVEAVFGKSLDELLAEIQGDAAEGYALAGHSYLASGYYEEAQGAFQEALARGGEAADVEPPMRYARGMAAYMKGRYAESVAELERWAEGDLPRDPALVDLAWTAVSKIGQLAREVESGPVVASAAALAQRLGTLRSRESR